MKKIRPGFRLILYTLLLCLLMPDIFRTNRIVALAFTAVRGFAGLLSIFLFMYKRQKNCLRKLAIYISYIGIVTLLHGVNKANIVRFIAIYADIFMIVVITEYLLHKDTQRFFRYLNVVLWSGLLLNTISIFGFKHGLVQVPNEVGVKGNYYFYDYDNHFIVRYIPTIAVIYLHEKYFSKHTRTAFLVTTSILVSLVGLIYLKSAASSVAMFIVLVGYLFINIIPSKITSFRFLWIGYIVVDFLLVLGNMALAGNDFISFLGKSRSLMIRQKMWGMALDSIFSHPIIGIGVLNASYMRENFLYAQLHNSLLTMLLWGGMIGLFLYTGFIFSLQSGFNLKNKNHRQDLKFFSILFAAVMVASLFDGLELLANLYLFYIIVGNYEHIEKFKQRYLENR